MKKIDDDRRHYLFHEALEYTISRRSSKPCSRAERCELEDMEMLQETGYLT